MPSTRVPVNRSEAIRKALAQHPEQGPSAIARLVKAQLRMPISTALVSKVKRRMAKMKRGAAKASPALAAARRTPALSASRVGATSVAEVVMTLQRYIHQLGKDELDQLIRAL